MSLAVACERSNYMSLWTLESDVHFLNHGSYGACPRIVQQAQQRLRELIERQPMRFFQRQLPDLLARAGEALAQLVGADAADLAFVSNATAGVNTVLRSLDLGPGDELLVTDHEYNACRNALEFVAGKTGAKVRVVQIPFPITGPDVVVQRLVDAVGPQTRLLLIDHITSPTGLVMPLEVIVPEMRRRGVECLVDGAHAVGQIPLSLSQLGAAWYTSNAHKWLCAPKGSAFLYVRKDMQDKTVPLAISHGFNAPGGGQSRFRKLFDWTGTCDPTPWLVLPDVINFFAELPGGLEAVQAHNRELCHTAQGMICEALGCRRPAPASMLAALASFEVPPNADNRSVPPAMLDPDQQRLLSEYGIEVPIFNWPNKPRRLLRISAQLYNCVDDYRALARALRALFGDP